jgi:uncharacterized protein YpmB
VLADNLVVGCKHLKEKRGSKMTIEITIVISAVSVAFAIYFGLKSNRRNDVKDIEERAANNAKVNMKLDIISSNVTDIKNETSATRVEVRNLTERVVAVEQSAKSAHHRLDDLVGKREDRNDA